MRRQTKAAAAATVTIALLGVGWSTRREVPVQEPTDALALFRAMMPVFMSPRCINCHGVVSPLSEAHGGGIIEDVVITANGTVADNSQCLLCHTANLKPPDPGWRLPPKSMQFVGKDEKALCRQMRRMHEEPEVFVEHLGHDYLVGLGFEGRRGDAAADAQPPPLGKAEMVKLARRWTEEGERGCGDWNGTVTYSWSEHSSEDEEFEIEKRNTRTDEDVEITVTSQDGKATAEVTGMKVTTANSVAKWSGCHLTSKTVVETETWTMAESADLVVKLIAPETYLITIALPPHKVHTVQESRWKGGTCPLFIDGEQVTSWDFEVTDMKLVAIDELIQFAGLGGKGTGAVLDGQDEVKVPGVPTRTLRWKLTRE